MITTSIRNAYSLILALALLALAAPAYAEQGDWLVRLRGIYVMPDDDSGLISLGTVPLAGSGVDVDSNPVPELDITYMLHRHWGIEVIAGITNHDVELEGPVLGLPDGFKIFDTWVLPPTVLLQYHFLPDSKIRPYVGLGVNYTAFLWNDATGALESAVGGPVDVDMENSWGWAAQGGVDIGINDRWFINVDLKYIDIDSTASLATPLGTLRVNTDIDPYIVGAGIGYRF